MDRMEPVCNTFNMYYTPKIKAFNISPVILPNQQAAFCVKVNKIKNFPIYYIIEDFLKNA